MAMVNGSGDMTLISVRCCRSEALLSVVGLRVAVRLKLKFGLEWSTVTVWCRRPY